MAGVHGAAAGTAPRHRAGGIGQGDGWLCCHQLQVTALGSPGLWAENKRLSVPAARMWGDTTRGRRGGPLQPQPQPQPGVTTAPTPPGHLLRVRSGPVRHRHHVNDPWIRAGKIHCPRWALPKLAPSRPKGRGGGGSLPPRIPRPQESGKRRYGNGCKAHPPRALRRQLCPIPKPPAARSERGRPAAAKGNPERKQPFEGLIL